MSAALVNEAVMTPAAGSPSLSAITASCKLHDEQLPQSPMPETSACQRAESRKSGGSAGAL